MYDVRVTLVIVLLYAYILSTVTHDVKEHHIGRIATEVSTPSRRDVNSSEVEDVSVMLKDTSTDNHVLTDTDYKGSRRVS